MAYALCEGSLGPLLVSRPSSGSLSRPQYAAAGRGSPHCAASCAAFCDSHAGAGEGDGDGEPVATALVPQPPSSKAANTRATAHPKSRTAAPGRTFTVALPTMPSAIPHLPPGVASNAPRITCERDGHS